MCIECLIDVFVVVVSGVDVKFVDAMLTGVVVFFVDKVIVMNL